MGRHAPKKPLPKSTGTSAVLPGLLKASLAGDNVPIMRRMGEVMLTNIAPCATHPGEKPLATKLMARADFQWPPNKDNFSLLYIYISRCRDAVITVRSISETSVTLNIPINFKR